MRIHSLAPWSLLLLASCAATSPTAAPSVAPAPAAPPTAAPPPPPPAPPSFGGIWLGTLQAGAKLRLQLHLDFTTSPATCTIDSLDQDRTGIACTDVVASGTSLSLAVPTVHGSLVGTLAPDGNNLNATWSQAGMGLALVMTRQAAAVEPVKAKFDPALPPVEIADLGKVLDADLAKTLASGELAPATEGGVTIGVVSHGVRRVLTYGATKPDSVFEIGSITKTFTGLVLAQMVEQKKARLDEPVRALLPPGTVAAPASGAEITLLDLSAQRSGLPRLPDNLKPADESNPYAGYGAKELYSFVGAHGVALPAKPEFGYSNLGVGLLGQALADRAGTTYEALLRKEVTGPLGMRETVITLSPALRARFAAGHDGAHKPARAWDIDALAGAGAVRSTAGDMLTYLEAQLHPDHLPATARASKEGKTLSAAIVASHVAEGEVGEGQHIALNWFRADATGNIWHNGATGGYSAFALFNPENDFGIIVLCNTSVGETSFADDLGQHIAQRLTGKPAIALGPTAK